MNFVDYILIAIVGLSMVLSLWRGFVREVISLIGLVAAFLLASRLSGVTGEFLGQWITSSTVADIAGFALVFIIVMIVVGLIGALIRHLVGLAALTATDRTLGIFFGAARGMMLIALCFLVYTSYAKPDAPWLKESRLVPYALNLGDMLGRMIPEGYPFSRQGGTQYVSPQTTNSRMQDLITVKDRQALKSIIQNSSK
ncbi:MAG: colicin V production protein [Zetaproteobacteria bacterium CG12_big_fil_rev_8_21_14_0_65_54_13]|nr:MAG: colicin V production protein [Zetaproteobacteria bacterium CG23_combo_of_CG06-09_8_20_14_all_54_7]PIW51587.1 MAG: colicin V production protein [Zetaproteobacteria bacterium CG12_big_fil_rev_8_21_14_0_65_54_13]PIX54941.1 MAG: colicin V production protein [Zetaproteobacteria bacterium CG_4_10_14_3_um_filter_54_28]PJA27063.1 MAG: colicin V production protein [Zetaproteobacteria bacterium CG_4_9_14_3_um_filter_54_145]